MNQWLYWAVPDERINHYLFFMVLAIFVLPYLFGIRFTPLGYLLNIVWLDVIYYMSYRNLQRLKNKHKDDDDGNNTF